jgi:hypothetical protein
MAAATIKAINAKIRSNPVSDYFCSTRMFSDLPFFCPTAVIARNGHPKPSPTEQFKRRDMTDCEKLEHEALTLW